MYVLEVAAPDGWGGDAARRRRAERRCDGVQRQRRSGETGSARGAVQSSRPRARAAGAGGAAEELRRARSRGGGRTDRARLAAARGCLAAGPGRARVAAGAATAAWQGHLLHRLVRARRLAGHHAEPAEERAGGLGGSVQCLGLCGDPCGAAHDRAAREPGHRLGAFRGLAPGRGARGDGRPPTSVPPTASASRVGESCTAAGATPK